MQVKEDLPSQASDRVLTNWLVGGAAVRRVGAWRFPVYELRQDDEVLAQMGRGGWFKVYLGRGQRVDLPNGDRWTVRSIGHGGNTLPIIIDSQRRRVTTAGMSHGTYGITGKDYGCVLYPKDKTLFGRENKWILRQHEDELAIITRSPLSIFATHPVHLGAVMMSFALIRYGLPEESGPRIPVFRWS